MEITALHVVWFIVLGIAFLLSVIATWAAWGFFPEEKKPEDPWSILPLVHSIRTSSKKAWKDADGKDREIEIDPEQAVLLAVKCRLLLTGALLGFAAFLVICSMIVLLNLSARNKDDERLNIKLSGEAVVTTPQKPTNGVAKSPH